MFELRVYKNETYVHILYKTSSNTPAPLYISKCDGPCTLKQMFKLFDASMPTLSIDVECGAKPKLIFDTRNYCLTSFDKI